MRDPLHWLDVKTKLTLTFIVISLVILGLGGTILSSHARHTLEREIHQRLEYQSRALAVALDAHLQMLMRRTEDFASDGYIRRHLEELENTSVETERTRLIQDLREHVERNKLPLVTAFAGLSLVLPGRGKACGASVVVPPKIPQDVEQSVAEASWAVDGPWQGGWTRLPKDAGHGPALIAMSTPLRSLDGTKGVGRLVAWVRPSVWISDALDRSELRWHDPEYGVLSVVDAAGRELHLGRSLLLGRDSTPDLETLESGFGLELSENPRVISAAEGGLARSFPIASTGLEARVHRRIDEARDASSALQGRFLAVGSVLAVVVGLLLFFPMRFIAKPLTHMTEAAGRLQSGDLTTRVHVSGTDELGQLGRAFNLMAEALEERTTKLMATAKDLRSRQGELRRESERLSAVISSMRDGLLVLDAEGEMVLANDAAHPLRTALENASRMSSHAPCQEAGGAEACSRCLQETPQLARTCLIDIGAGVFEVHTTSFLSGDSGRKGSVFVSRDVTERVAREEREIHQERLSVLGEVAAVMAHELNNPLTSISMFSQMIADEAEPESSLAENVAVVRRNAETCKRVIRELLDYATDANPEIASVDVHEVLHDAARFLRPLRDRTRVHLTLDLSAAHPIILGDEVQLRQIFVNLMVNAIQSIEGLGRGGQLVISSRDVDEGLEVLVRDTGGGIPDRVRDQVFKPFFTTKPRGQGTGLGLPTSLRLAKMHGGGIDIVESSSAGTTFRVRLRAERGGDA